MAGQSALAPQQDHMLCLVICDVCAFTASARTVDRALLTLLDHYRANHRVYAEATKS